MPTKRFIPLLAAAAALALALIPRAALAQHSPTSSLNARNARAAALPRARLHVITRGLLRRLGPQAQRNVRSVARFGRRATGFMVLRATGQDARRALVLTNYHVAGGDNFRPGEPLTFSDAVRGSTTRVVASSRTLDYALVEIDLPPDATAPAVLLRASGMAPSERVYSVSAYPSLRVDGPLRDAVAVNRDNRTLVQIGVRRGAPTIQTGHLPADVSPIPITAGGQHEMGVLTDMPNRPGGSGSPVFGHSDHRVVGLHTSGGGHPGPWESSEIPIDTILADISHSLDQGHVPAESRDLAGALVRQYRTAR